MTAHVGRRKRYRVWLDGADVSDQSFYADARRGVVRLYKRDEDGHFYVEGDRAAREERRGKVRIRRMED